jgi:hypothetical protein
MRKRMIWCAANGGAMEEAIVSQLRGSVERGIAWVEGQAAEDGSFRGAKQELSAYYKSLLAFATCGRIEAGARSLVQLHAGLLGPGAELFSDGGTAKTSITRMGRNLANYMDGWVALGAWLLHDFGLAEQICQRLGRDQSNVQGGILTGPQRWSGRPRYDLATAASCGRAFLVVGHRDRALRVGAFLIGALEHQHEFETGLDLSFDENFNPVKTPDPSEYTYYRYDLAARDKKLWFAAFPCAFLCELYQVSSDERHLQAAQSYFSFIERSPELRDGTIANGKSGWAAGLLAHATSDVRYWKILEVIAPNVVARQGTDGQFHESAGGHSTGAAAASATSSADVGRRLERTAEFTTWVAEFLRMFSAGAPA